MKKYKNKYRMDTIRAQWWDYGWNGAYFITICTHQQEHFFGEIKQGQCFPSDAGILVENIWLQIPEKFPYAKLHDYIIMPNHLHGIILIDKPLDFVETRLIASLPNKSGGFASLKNPMLNDNISRVIRWFKGRCTFELKKNIAHFSWQPRFYDRIIRNDEEYQRIRQYILQNPEQWEINRDEHLLV